MKFFCKAPRRARLSEIVLAECPWISGRKLKELLSARELRLNGKRTAEDLTAEAGDLIEAYLPDPPEIRAVYSDDNIVVADKPAHVDSVAALPKALSARFGELYPVHRLDTNTTGVVVLARNEGAKASLERAFKRHEVIKQYVATVTKAPSPRRGTLRGWLVKDSASGRVRVYDAPVKGGVEAVTEYETAEGDDGLYVVKLRPLTGRTHQLRAQLAHIGCPILGDGKYGDFAENKKRGVKQQRLRAVSITFTSIGGELGYLRGKTFEV